jgi:hypothetical protein
MDSYAMLWPPFQHGLAKYWKDCPWPIYFITNFKDAPVGFTTIKTGKEINWTDKVKKALVSVDSEIIFWMMEDFWLPGPVQTDALIRFYQLMMEHKRIAHIRLMCPSYGVELAPRKECSHESDFDEKLWHFKPDAEYRCSVSAALWRKDVLLEFLNTPSIVNPWTFEQEASVLSMKTKRKYLCVVDPYIFPLAHYTNPYAVHKHEIVSKGRWNTLAAYEYALKEGLTVDFSRHPNGEVNIDFYTLFQKELPHPELIVEQGRGSQVIIDGDVRHRWCNFYKDQLAKIRG